MPNLIRLIAFALLTYGLGVAAPVTLVQAGEATGAPKSTADAPAPVPRLAADGQAGNFADDLRSDAAGQANMSDIEKEIERTWQIVEEVKLSAQNLRLAHQAVKDALANQDCAVAASTLQMIRRSEETIGRLSRNLEAQCAGVQEAAQKNLAAACETERQTLTKERATIEKQREQVLSMCPQLRR